MIAYQAILKHKPSLSTINGTLTVLTATNESTLWAQWHPVEWWLQLPHAAAQFIKLGRDLEEDELQKELRV